MLFPYLYLKKRIIPRFKKMMQEMPLPHPDDRIFFASYLALLSNYSYEQKHNTALYRLIKPYNFLAHVSPWEIFLGKIAWRAKFIFKISAAASFFEPRNYAFF